MKDLLKVFRAPFEAFDDVALFKQPRSLHVILGVCCLASDHHRLMLAVLTVGALHLLSLTSIQERYCVSHRSPVESPNMVRNHIPSASLLATAYRVFPLGPNYHQGRSVA